MNLEELEGLAKTGEALALVTVADVKGSAPRHPGSTMLVSSSGLLSGTIGGGKGEAMAIEAGLRALKEGRSAFIEVEMLGSDPEGTALICGGINRMVIEYVPDPAPYALALELLREGRRLLIVRSLGNLGKAPAPSSLPISLGLSLWTEEGELVWGQAPLPQASADVLGAAFSSGKACLVEAPEGSVLVDPLMPAEKLFILGGGHVGLALAKAALDLGFEISVGDDRPEFTAEGRFPRGVTALGGKYSELVASFPFDRASYAVILSRGHLFDLECSRAVLKRPFRYAGLIGSKRKVALIREQLLADGIDPALVASLHSPIGIPIGAETPAEIAISILGEIIAVRHGLGGAAR